MPRFASTTAHINSTFKISIALALLALVPNFNVGNNAIAEEASTRPSASSAAVKNVLFIVSDDLKASVLGCYGDPFCKTPNIDRLAASGMVFERAYCQGTWCAPSRQSFMHSRYSDKSGINLGEHLIANGFYSGRIGKIYHMRVPGDIIDGTDGLDIASTWTERFNSPGQEAHTPGDYACLNLNIFTDAPENRQSTRMPHRMFVSVEIDGDGSDQPDHKSATKAIELLQRHQQDPFFLAVGLVRPHYPMVAPREYFANYPWEDIELPHVPENDLEDIPKLGQASMMSTTNPIGKYPDNQKRMWAAYYASVAFMDTQVGRILDELDRLGLTDTTAIVFTSDHGYHLGEHYFWQKSNLHEEVLRVPMIISVPGMQAGRTQSLVELVDIYPTVTDLLNLPNPESVQGKSLTSVIKDPTATVRKGALSLHNGHSWRTNKWHLMSYKDGALELYDMEQDPNEFHNLAEVPKHAETLARLRAELAERLSELK